MMTSLNTGGYDRRRFSIYSIKDLESADYISEDSENLPDLSTDTKQHVQNFNKTWNKDDDSQDDNHKEEQKEEGGRETWSLGRMEEYNELQKQGLN